MNKNTQMVHECVEWAQQVLSQDVVIWDCETTSYDGAICQLSAIDKEGNPLISTLLNPQMRIHPGATKVHGITNGMVTGAPLFASVYPQIAEVFNHRVWVIYNAKFDVARMNYETDRAKLARLNPSLVECAMINYAKFHGTPRHQGGWKWIPLQAALKVNKIQLEGRAHNSLSDCYSTLALIKFMADQ